MAIIKLNNQSISAVTALPSGVGGKVVQVIGSENAVVSDYTGTEGTEYDVTKSGTWETSITMNQGNKLFYDFSFKHFKR